MFISIPISKIIIYIFDIFSKKEENKELLLNDKNIENSKFIHTLTPKKDNINLTEEDELVYKQKLSEDNKNKISKVYDILNSSKAIKRSKTQIVPELD